MASYFLQAVKAPGRYQLSHSCLARLLGFLAEVYYWNCISVQTVALSYYVSPWLRPLDVLFVLLVALMASCQSSVARGMLSCGLLYSCFFFSFLFYILYSFFFCMSCTQE